MADSQIETVPTLERGWKISKTDQDDTGLRIASIEHPDPNIDTIVSVVEFNPEVDVAAVVAWAGSRTSRSDDPFTQIFAEIQEAYTTGQYDAAGKLAKVFTGYGHASVADMAPVFLYINKIPINLAFWVFNHMSVGAGQELSTRFVELEDLGVDTPDFLLPLETIDPTAAQVIRDRWETLLTRSKENYHKWYGLVSGVYGQKFAPAEGEKPLKDSTLNARSLDIARMWIPAGASTSMALLMSARSWVDMVSQLRGSKDKRIHELGEQIFAALNITSFPETADIRNNLTGLTKYSEAKGTIPSNLTELDLALKNIETFSDLLQTRNLGVNTDLGHDTSVELIDLGRYSPGAAVVMQYVINLYPDLDEVKVLEWLNTLEDDYKAELGRIVFQTHDRHNLMRNMGDIRGPLMILETALAYVRDLNRHRAFGRFTPYVDSSNVEAILQQGFNRNHQVMNTKGMEHLREGWNNDMNAYYTELLDLFRLVKANIPDVDDNFILRLIPLGHQVKMHMSAPLTQYNYMIDLRNRPGGDIGYIHITAEMIEQLRKSDPFLRSMLQHVREPDLDSRDQFANRG